MTLSNIGMFFLTMATPLWVAVGLNVISNIFIGSLMMPLLTWGTSNVNSQKVADYGDNALMHGMNISLLWMAVGSLVRLVISICGVRSSKAVRESC